MDNQEWKSAEDELAATALQRPTMPGASPGTMPMLLYSPSTSMEPMYSPSAGMLFTEMSDFESIRQTSDDQLICQVYQDVWPHHLQPSGRFGSRNSYGTMSYLSRLQQQGTRPREVLMFPTINMTSSSESSAPSLLVYPQDTVAFTNTYSYDFAPITTVQNFQMGNTFGEGYFAADLFDIYGLSMGNQLNEEYTQPVLPYPQVSEMPRYDHIQAYEYSSAVLRPTILQSDDVPTRECPICARRFRGTCAQRNLTRHLESQHVQTVGLNFADDGKKHLYCRLPSCNKGPYRREDSLLKHERHHAELGLMPAIKRKRSDCPQNSTPSFSSPNGNIGSASVPGAPRQQRSAFEGPWLMNQ